MILLGLVVWLGGNLLLALVCGGMFVRGRLQERRERLALAREFERIVVGR